MNALAGLSQQIINQPQVKAPEKSLHAKDKGPSASSRSESFKDSFDKIDSKKDREIPVSKNESVREVESSSPENYHADERVDRKVEKQSLSEDKNNNKALTKQEAMWAFLEQMQTELGIEPSEVLQAFAQMDVDSLSAPPEQSADEFIANLNLDPESEDKALNLYSQLLTWTSAASLSQQLQNQGQQAEMAVLTPQEYQKQQRLQGLEDLSNRFFMNGQHTRENVIQSRQNMNGFAEQNPMMAGQSDIADKLMDQRMSQAGYGPANASVPAEGKTAGVTSTEELLRQMQMEMDMSSTEPLALTKPEVAELGMPQKLQALKSYGQSQMGGEASFQQPVMNQTQMNEVFNVNSATEVIDPTTQAVATGDNLMAFSDDSSEQGEMNLEGGDLSAQEATIAKGQKADSAQFVVKAPEPTETEMSENIREIINKAKVIVKDGGGEMKVSLRPEGMGDVTLKVNVQDGDVSVEMVTASKEAKKLLEKGLADLRDNLSSHKLNVEQIKVESAQESAEKMMQQRQEQAERHFQERFLQDFKNQNGFRRSAEFGIEPAGRPGSQGLTESGSSSKKKQSDRRLDLVA